MAASVREQRIGLPTGETLFGKTALVIGYGGIARQLVPRCKHLSILSSWQCSPDRSASDAECAGYQHLKSTVLSAPPIALFVYISAFKLPVGS